MEWLDTITNMLGVNPVAFLALTIIVIVLVAALRALGVKVEKTTWWKIVLTTSALALGVVGAMLFWKAGLYKIDNVWLVMVAGLFNGTLASVGQQYLKKIPWVGKWLKGVVPLLLVCVLFEGCGTWLNDTRTGVLAANASLNAYDDVASEVWADAATNPLHKGHLGKSLCASLLVQDALVQSWALTGLVKKGIAKESDIGAYAADAITVIDALADYLEVSNVAIPPALKVAVLQLHALNPHGVAPNEPDPFSKCADVLAQHVPAAAPIPWGTIISASSELALFLMQIIKDRLAGKDVPDDALDIYLREMLKQQAVYEKAE